MVAAYIPTSCSKQLWVSIISQSLVLVDSGDCLIIETHNCFEQLTVYKQLLPFAPLADVSFSNTLITIFGRSFSGPM